MKIKNSKLKRFKPVLVILVILAILGGIATYLSQPATAAWYGDTWGYRKKLTIDHTKVSGGADLSSFPILVSLTNGSLSKAQSTGNDILFTSSNGTTKLDHEIEKFTQSSGTLVAWVRIPTLSYQNDTVIYMYYGCNFCASQQNKTGVWDGNYVAVYHFNETSGLHYDSTNTNDSDSVIVTQQGTNIGIVDGADKFNGTTDRVRIPNSASLLPSSDITVESWSKLDTLPMGGGNNFDIVNKETSGNNAYYLYVSSNDNEPKFGWQNSSGTSYFSYYNTAMTTGSWFYSVGVHDSSVLRFYYNGSATNTTNGSPTGTIQTANASNLDISTSVDANKFPGTIDEFRISNIARTAGWIATTYNTISNNASFFSAKGNEEQNKQPVLNFKFDEGYGTTTNDTSPNKLIGTLSGANELVQNPGFETPGGGGADVWANWTENTNGHGTMVNETSLVHSGSSAAKLTRSSDPDDMALAQTIFNVTPGAAYTFSFWTRADGSGKQGRARVYNANDWSEIIPQYFSGVTGSTYTQVSRTFIIPTGCTKIELDLNPPWEIGSAVYFDDVSLKPNLPTWETEDMCVSGKCLYLNGVDNSVTVSGTVPNVQTVSFWEKNASSSGTIPLLKLSSSANVSLTGGNTVTATGFTSPTVYVNGIAGSAVSPNVWNHIEITDTGTTTANALVLGTINSATYFQGFLDEFKLYDYPRTAAQVKLDYNSKSAATSRGSNVSFGGQTTDALSKGLVGYWKMDEATWSGTLNEVKDSSGNGNHGQAGGTTGGKAYPSSSKFGNGGYFDGVDDYVDLGSPDILKNIDSNHNWTISMWYKSTDATSDTRFLLRWVGAWILDCSHEWGSDNCYFQQDSGSWSLVNSTIGSFSANVWHHLVLTGSGTSYTIRFYVDGIDRTNLNHPYSDFTWSGSSPTQDFIVGGSTYGIGSNWQGNIDDLRVYNRALSPAEVSQLYNWAPGPVGYWKLDEGSGTNTYDSSGNNNPAIITSGSATSVWTAGKAGDALSFDGYTQYATIADSSILRPGTNDYTIGLWVKTPITSNGEGSGWGGIFTKGLTTSAPAHTWGFDRLSTTNNRIEFLQAKDSGGDFDVQIDTPVLSNGWHYLVARRISATTQLYVDGVYISQSTNGGDNLSSTSDILLGKNNFSYTQVSIDEIRYYNYARTPAQIVEDMNAGHPAPGSPVGSSYIHYDFDENNGTTAHNTGNGGSSTNGTISNGTWNSSGKFGSALTFTSNTSVTATITDPGYINSLSLWLYPTTSVAGKTLVTSSKLTTDSLSRPQYGSCIGYVIPLNQWTHLVAVSDGSGTCTIYQNGALASTSTAGVTFGTSLNIGASGFTGIIDEFKLYASALTADQVKAEYNQGYSQTLGSLSDTSSLTGGGIASNSASSAYCVPGSSDPCSPPVAYWKFDENIGTTAYDSSGNGYNTTESADNWAIGKMGSSRLADSTHSTGQTQVGGYLDNASKFTFAFWVKINSHVDWANSLANKNLDNNDRMLISEGVAANQGRLYFFLANGSNSYTYADNLFTLGQWFHIEEVYDGSGSANSDRLKVYINGQSTTLTFSGTIPATTPNIPSTSFYASAGGGSSNNTVDDFRIYNYARTPTQIAWDMNHGAPIAQYDSDECTGTVLHDTATKANKLTTGYNGTIIPDTGRTAGTCGSGVSTEMWNGGTTGKYNGSLAFDGSFSNNADAVTISPSDNLNLTTGGTIVAWIKPHSPGGGWYGRIIDKSSDTNGTGGYTLFMNNGNRLGANINHWGIACSATDNSVPFDQWTHVAWTFDGSTSSKIYINGILNNNNCGDNTLPPATSLGVTIGNRQGDRDRAFDGQIDDVRIYNYALTATQVKTIYNNGSAVSF